MSTTYYGEETKKSLGNFSVSPITVDLKIIYALADIKKAAAITNAKLKNIPKNISESIIKVCEEVVNGKLDDQFVTCIIQGGAGTSINMNVNEVIANRASEILGKEFGYVSDLEHVNFAQSTNDCVPTAIKIASVRLMRELIKELQLLSDSFEKKGKEFKDILKVGRTHLQDAVPISLGQEFNAYAHCARRGAHRLKYFIKGEILCMNMGGTAVGTGIGSSRLFIENIANELRKVSGIDVKTADDLIDTTQNVDIFVDLSGRIKAIFTSLSKIANDLRMMAGGPVANIKEINLPERQKGSSIMPGKVNPVIPEMINQVYFQILGNDATITEAASQGQFELNVMGPVLAFNLIQSLDLAKNSLKLFRENCIDGITANKERCHELLEKSYCMATALNKELGYYKVSEILKKSLETGQSIREIVLKEKVLEKDRLDEILDAKKLIYPQ